MVQDKNIRLTSPQRSFGFTSMLGFCIVSIGTWEGAFAQVFYRKYVAALIHIFQALGSESSKVCGADNSFLGLTYQILSGGPAGIVYSYILVWAGNLATFSCLAELASLWVSIDCS